MNDQGTNIDQQDNQIKQDISYQEGNIDQLYNQSKQDISNQEENLDQLDKRAKQDIYLNDDFIYQNENPYIGYLCFRQRSQYITQPDRKLLNQKLDFSLPNNIIKTNKYNVISFLPINLFEQFSKLANTYFLFIGIMEMIPLISLSDNKPIIYLPLSVVVLISVLRDLLEDYNRYQSDQQENNRKITIVQEKNEESIINWSQLYVGNFIKILKNEYIPADIIILKSSDPKGTVMIETKNLDGETNLKHKQAHKITQRLSVQDLSTPFTIQYEYERQNPYIYRFQGTLTINKESFTVDFNHMLLRGCSLKNTEYVYGFVAYSGHDTKIMLNSVSGRIKHSKVEGRMNFLIKSIFIIQIVLTFLIGFYSSLWFQQNLQNMIPYLCIPLEDTHHRSFFISLFEGWGSWILLFTNFVPISLIVSLEMVKYFQGVIISKDPKMISKDLIEAAVHTSSLNEECGQVNYIFSDKTGTLTSNIMKFKKLIINGKGYGDDYSLSDSEMLQFNQVTNVDFRDRLFMNILQDPLNVMQQNIEEFLFHLSICHTVMAELNEETQEITFNSSSPDESALLNFAKFCGFLFKGVNLDNILTILYNEKEYYFKILFELAFNSTRKRQSVIFEDQQTNKFYIYTKGADNIIESRGTEMNEDTKHNMQKLLESYASTGLRTLVLACKEIPKEELEEWSEKYQLALNCIDQNRDELIEKLQDEIEQNLRLIGATAIEDMLQDKVGETIEILKEAGIKIWVLTGDKVETAINVGYSCNLLNLYLTHLLIDSKSRDDLLKTLEETYDQIFQSNNKQQQEKFALIISGDSLLLCQEKQQYQSLLINIAKNCEVTLACRVSPKQKADIVRMMRSSDPAIVSLAIGDGANDVNMITAAHVGVGIRGVEGQQAARASDVSIGEFKMLKNLLLVHGRECYRKNTTLINYNFYKNILYVMPNFWYGFYNGFSATELYDLIIYQFFNMCYTALPIIMYSLKDQDQSYDELVTNPIHYQLGLQDEMLSVQSFLFWISLGILQSLMVVTFSFRGFESIQNEQGKMFFFSVTGMIIFGMQVIISNIKILIFANEYNIIQLFLVYGGIIFYVSNLALVSDFFVQDDLYATFCNTYGNMTFWLVFIGILTVTSLIDNGYNTYFKLITQANLQNQQIERKRKVQLQNIPPLIRQHTGFAFSQDEKIQENSKFYIQY